MTTYSETTDGHHYRAQYNPAFVQRVMARRKRDAQKAELAAEADARRLREEQESMQTELIAAQRAALAESRKAEQSFKATEAYRIISVFEASEGRQPARSIIEHVSMVYGIPYREIIGASRMRATSKARMVAMYEVRKQRPDLSYPQIGKIFGGRDHTTVIHAVQKIEAQRAASKQEGQNR